MSFDQNILYRIIKVLLVVIGTLGMMCSTTRFKYSTKRVISCLLLYLCYVSISSAVIISLFGYLFFLRVLLLTVSAPAIYLVFKLAGDQPSRAVFNYATQILFSLYISASITLFIIHINGSNLTSFFIHFITYGIIIILDYRFLRRPFLNIFSIAKNGWLILSLVPCSLMILAVVIASYPIHYTQNPTGIMLVYLLGAVIIVIYFAIFQFLFMQYRFQTTKQDMELLKIQNGSLKEKMAQDAAVTEQSRIDKHDTRHKLHTIACLLENGQTQEALEYITKSVSQLQTKPSVTYCKDVLLNATLSSYFGRAKKAGVKLETRLSLPDTLPIDSGEFSIVVANALENAIIACCLLPEEQRRLIFKCIHKPKLMLEISNPCKDHIIFSEDGVPLSDEKEHGIGTRSIMAFCQKHHALCSFALENGWFILKIVL